MVTSPAASVSPVRLVLPRVRRERYPPAPSRVLSGCDVVRSETDSQKADFFRFFLFFHQDSYEYFNMDIYHVLFFLSASRLAQVLNSVSWAKFGKKSAQDFIWNCIKEKIASIEGLEARDVAAMLRNEVAIEFVDQ